MNLIYFPKCGVCDGKEHLVRLAPSMPGILMGREKIICLKCLLVIRKKFGYEDYDEIGKIFLGSHQLCSLHNELKNIFERDKEGKWKGHCFFCEKEKWEKNLKHLELSPLSVAKYFYEERKITNPIIMQRLVYFAYLELLEKENTVLFKEKFQAWPGGPVLESIIYPMYEKHGKLKSFFKKIVSIDNTLVLNYLENISQKFLGLKSSQICREARNELWEKARQGLINEGESRPIDETNLFIFIQANKNQLLLSVQ